jgi:Zn-dependent metalloprotease
VKIDKFLGKINSKNEEERLRLLWFLVGFFMLIVFGLWFFNFNSNLSRLGGFSLDTSTLPSFPEVDQVGHLEEIAERGNEILESAGADFSQEYWQNVGQKYLADKNFLKEEDFSELKIAEIKNENGVVLMKYEHYYKGLLVYGSNLILHFDVNSGEFIKAEDSLKKGVDIEIDPVISSQKSIEIAKQQLNNSDVSFKNSSLVVITLEEKQYLVWHLFFDNLKDSSKVQIFVGAKNGGVILPEELDK